MQINRKICHFHVPLKDFQFRKLFYLFSLLLPFVICFMPELYFFRNSCLPACLPACLYACLPACLPACYLPDCMPTCMNACLHACLSAFQCLSYACKHRYGKPLKYAFLVIYLQKDFAAFFCLTIRSPSYAGFSGRNFHVDSHEQRDQCILFSVVFTPSPTSYHGSV
jgi:hypothetical protein